MSNSVVLERFLEKMSQAMLFQLQSVAVEMDKPGPTIKTVGSECGHQPFVFVRERRSETVGQAMRERSGPSEASGETLRPPGKRRRRRSGCSDRANKKLTSFMTELIT